MLLLLILVGGSGEAIICTLPFPVPVYPVFVRLVPVQSCVILAIPLASVVPLPIHL